MNVPHGQFATAGKNQFANHPNWDIIAERLESTQNEIAEGPFGRMYDLKFRFYRLMNQCADLLQYDLQNFEIEAFERYFDENEVSYEEAILSLEELSAELETWPRGIFLRPEDILLGALLRQ